MRITIESGEDGVEVREAGGLATTAAASAGEGAPGPEAIDAGPPPDDLVAAIEQAGGSASTPAATDAGPASAE